MIVYLVNTRNGARIIHTNIDNVLLLVDLYI